MASILMVVSPEKFRDEELFVPKEYFEKHGIKVDVASTRTGICNGMLGGSISATLAINQIDTSHYDAVVFVGGAGTPLVRKDSNAIRIAREAFAKGKLVCAICWAPTILAKAGILNGKNATVWVGPDKEFGVGTNEYLERQGAHYVAKGVVEDDNIITADGPASALEFAKRIVKKFGK